MRRPLYAIRDLLDHWQLENLHIYEPFIGSGHSTKCMRKLGHTVYAPGGDFFTHGVPDRSLYLITNPPFSIKKEILRKIFVEWNHPRVALLLARQCGADRLLPRNYGAQSNS